MKQGTGSARCRECGAEIIWVRMDNGRLLPVDAQTCIEGNIIVWRDLDTGETIGRHATDSEARPLHRSHYASCPGAVRMRHG